MTLKQIFFKKEKLRVMKRKDFYLCNFKDFLKTIIPGTDMHMNKANF